MFAVASSQAKGPVFKPTNMVFAQVWVCHKCAYRYAVMLQNCGLNCHVYGCVNSFDVHFILFEACALIHDSQQSSAQRASSLGFQNNGKETPD